MKYFLLYIIVSTLITLISIMFAYKPEEEQEDRRSSIKEIKGKQKESNPVYTSKKPKTTIKQESRSGSRALLI